MSNDINQAAENDLTRVRLYHLNDILERMKKNLNLINSGPNVQLVQAINTDLFRLALTFYNDINGWILIARANNLDDTQINGMQTLVIPPYQKTDNVSINNA